MGSIVEERKETGVYEGSESLKTGAIITQRLTDDKTIEKLERVEEGVLKNKVCFEWKLRRVIMSQ